MQHIFYFSTRLQFLQKFSFESEQIENGKFNIDANCFLFLVQPHPGDIEVDATFFDFSNTKEEFTLGPTTSVVPNTIDFLTGPFKPYLLFQFNDQEDQEEFSSLNYWFVPGSWHGKPNENKEKKMSLALKQSGGKKGFQ